MSTNRRDFLVNASLSLSTLLSASSFSKMALAIENIPANTPGLFDAEQKFDLAQICEIIIPQTDTPGAIEVGVPKLIEQIVAFAFSPEERNTFIAGFAKLNHAAKLAHHNSFVKISAGERQSLISFINSGVRHRNEFEDRFAKAFNSSKGLDSAALLQFFTSIKSLTLLCFFRSEVGATQVLQYKPIPGSYRACAPLKEIGKTWATR